MENIASTAQANESFLWALASIPAGRVITYGQLAQCCGKPGGARQIAKRLSQLPSTTHLPWHRVVNARGQLSLPEGSASYNTQRERLIGEGVVFTGKRIKLAIYGYNAQAPV